jgi:uncharacterized protein (TIGR01777 family)
MKKIVISGAGGFVGEALSRHFAETGVEVVRLVRGKRPPTPSERPWNPARGELDPAVLAGADAVINLNGRSIAGGRWTTEVKDELRSSRLDATTTLVDAIARADTPPGLLVNASATGFYGTRGDEVLTEGAPEGAGFLADLARDWEEAAAGAGSAATRVVMLRLGMVIGDGGALKKMLLPFKLGLGGPMGSGRQWWPWIGMNDVVGVVDHVLGHQDLAGPVNVVAPEAVTSKGFARALGKYLGVPAIVPAPAFAVRLALGEMADALLLSSTKAVPRILEETGYTFRTPTLAEAFRSALG